MFTTSRNLVFISVFLIVNGACTPWVKTYERANLASDLMAYDRDPISDSYMHHVRQARESARGAEGSGGGGCGCG